MTARAPEMRILIVLICVLGPASAHADPKLDKSLLSSGGELMTSGSVQLNANLGDVIAGPSLQGTTDIWAGFWTPNMVPVVEVEVPRAPSAHFLSSPQPNPARLATVIEFGLTAEQREMRLEIYDVAGGLVRRLASGPQAAGVHRVTWDLRSDHGARVPAGVYFSRFSTGRFDAVRKLVVLD